MILMIKEFSFQFHPIHVVNFKDMKEIAKPESFLSVHNQIFTDKNLFYLVTEELSNQNSKSIGK